MSSYQRSILDSRLYLLLRHMTEVFLLNLSWSIAALPIVTAVPATAALLATQREREAGECPRTVRRFLHHFCANFGASFLYGLVLTAFGVLLLLNLHAATLGTDVISRLLVVVVLLQVMFALGLTTHYVAILVRYRSPWRRRITAGLLHTIGRPAETGGCIVVIGLATAATYAFPLLPLISATVIAGVLLRLTGHAYARTAPAQEVQAA